ncbi:hypothetical protein HDU80_002067 [Chytriomyces hyalinus]|nr:hypothetical protein HDU80_002067 [Chytriomyces hyalinus]
MTSLILLCCSSLKLPEDIVAFMKAIAPNDAAPKRNGIYSGKAVQVKRMHDQLTHDYRNLDKDMQMDVVTHLQKDTFVLYQSELNDTINQHQNLWIDCYITMCMLYNVLDNAEIVKDVIWIFRDSYRKSQSPHDLANDDVSMFSSIDGLLDKMQVDCTTGYKYLKTLHPKISELYISPYSNPGSDIGTVLITLF